MIKNNQYHWENIIKYAIDCIKIEAKSYPSLGLVSKKNSGCHKDMDISTFIKSADSFNDYFVAIVNLVNKQQEITFQQLRDLGKEAEKNMLRVTNNVNTHKGLIFSFGIIFYITIYSIYHEINFKKMSSLIKKFVKPLKFDFLTFNNATYGEKIFQMYKIKGVRGIALKGYKIVFKSGLKFLNQNLKKYPFLTWENKSLILLIFYLSKINDTTLINKIGYQKSLKIKKNAKAWIKVLKKYGWKKFYQLVLKNNVQYIKECISPGGCADLCVITLFLSQFI